MHLRIDERTWLTAHDAAFEMTLEMVSHDS
jgi:hypothetical protein